MKIAIFINIDDISVTEEIIANKLIKIPILQGGRLHKSPDKRDCWILNTTFNDEFKNHYTQSFLNYLGDNIHKLLEVPVYVSIWANNRSVYPNNQKKYKTEKVSKVKETLFDFSGDDISTDPRFW